MIVKWKVDNYRFIIRSPRDVVIRLYACKRCEFTCVNVCCTRNLEFSFGLASFNYSASADESVSPDAWNIKIAHSEFVFFFFFFPVNGKRNIL